MIQESSNPPPVIRFRWLFVVASFLVLVVIASGMSNLTFTTNYRIFFSKDNPQLAAFEQMQQVYQKSDNILFVLAPNDGDVFTRSTLKAIHEMSEEALFIPFNSRVDSITNFQHTYSIEDDLIVEDLFEADLFETVDGLTDEQIQQKRAVAIAEPLLVNQLISPDGDVTAINVTVNMPVESANEVVELAKHARTLARKYEAEYPQLKIYITGIQMMNNAFAESSQKDMETLIPLMFLVVIITLWLMTRSISCTIGTFFVVIFSILSAMGTIGWFGWKLSSPMMAAPVVILTMAIADCVHFCITYLHEFNRADTGYSNALQRRWWAIKESLRINHQPIFITTVTTAIGFLSMRFSEVPPLRDLGSLVAIGVGFAYLYTLTFLPAFLALVPLKERNRQEGDQGFKGRIMARIAQFVIIHRSRLLLITGLMTVASIAMIPMNQLDDAFVEYFAPSLEFRESTDFATKHLTGIYTIEYSFTNEESGSISDPNFLAQVDTFVKWSRSQPEVLHVDSITDTFKRLNKNLHGDDPDWYKLPDSQALAAQYLLLYEMSLPMGLDLTNQISIDKRSTRVRVTFESLTTQQMLEIEQRFDDWLSENSKYIEFQAASTNLMFSHIGKRNTESLVTGVVLALALISAILVVSLRSLKIGFISLMPNLLPAGIAFGVWGLCVGKVGMSLATGIGVTLGIVVDDTVHFLSKYLRARREKGMDSEAAVRYAFSVVGVALAVTTTVLAIGFTILAMSTFKQNSDLGIFTGITLIIALLMDFFFLPPLLMKVDGDKEGASKEGQVDQESGKGEVHA